MNNSTENIEILKPEVNTIVEFVGASDNLTAPLTVEQCLSLLGSDLPTVNRIKNPKGGSIFIFKPQNATQISRIYIFILEIQLICPFMNVK